jgi:hypothetical protein
MLGLRPKKESVLRACLPTAQRLPVQTERKIGTSRFQGSYSNLAHFTAKGEPHLGVSGHSAATIKRAAHGYEPTREAAMAAFAKIWRRDDP